MITSISPIRRSAGWGNIFIREYVNLKKKLFEPPFLPHKKGSTYYNYLPEDNGQTEQPESLLRSMKMYLLSHLKGKKAGQEVHAWIDSYSGKDCSDDLVITWLGHATMLIQIANLNILTDPIIKSPSLLYKRILPFGCQLENLPKIDIVLLSHNHRDHMDSPTLKALHMKDRPLFLVPEGNKKWFLSAGIENVQEFSWWQTWQAGSVDLTFVPAWHWSQRGLFDHNKSLWGGWVIQSKQDTVYFAGDTAYNQHYFTSIKNCFPSIDVAILPIGPCDPDELMRRSHMSAQDSGNAFLDCGATYFIPMHWGTFYFGTDLFHTPIERLTNWWNQSLSVLEGKHLFACKVGQQFHLEHHKSSYSNRHDQNR